MSDLDNDYLWEDGSASVEEEGTGFVPGGSDPNDESIYFDEDNHEEVEQGEEQEQTGEEPGEKLDYLSRLLKARGVDRQKVRIENDEGEIEEYNFDDLDDDTKYGILSTNPDSVLSDNEIEEINFLRKNRMNLRDFARWQQEQAIKDYLEQNQTQTYTVDQLSDDDLYRFDLQDQMPDLTDEEVEDALTRAKENEAFFQKKITALRKEYKDLEDEQVKQKEEEATAKREAEFNQLAQSLIDVARNTEEMNGMVLDNNDRNEVLSFLLDRDANGQSQFYKQFEDPDALFKMAWFMLKGQEAYNALSDYYKGEIAKARRAAKPEEKKTPKVIRRAQPKSSDSDPYDLDSVFKNK